MAVTVSEKKVKQIEKQIKSNLLKQPKIEEKIQLEMRVGVNGLVICRGEIEIPKKVLPDLLAAMQAGHDPIKLIASLIKKGWAIKTPHKKAA